jgi:uncharacterized protein
VAGLVAATVALARLPVPPAPARRLNDYTGALTSAERDRLEARLAAHERQSSNQVVVAIFRSLSGESLEEYSVRLAQTWRVGQKGLDNGVVFLIFLDDRKMRLEVGYGLEATLTDAVAASIVRDVVAPRFRDGRLAEGIAAGLDAIETAITGAYAPPRRRSGLAGIPGVALVGLGLIGATALPLAFLTLVQARRSRRHGWTGGGQGWSRAGPGGIGGWPDFGVPGPIGPRGEGADPDTFRGGGGQFGGGGASGSW